MLTHAFRHSFELAVLASRDADFAGVVRILKELGCNVELVLFDGLKGSAQELSENVDHVAVITPEEYALCEKTS